MKIPKFLTTVYTVTIIKNGSFCWDVVKRTKADSELKTDLKWLAVSFVFCVLMLAV